MPDFLPVGLVKHCGNVPVLPVCASRQIQTSGKRHCPVECDIYATVCFLFIDKLYGVLQMFTFLTIPILAQYNGERGKRKGMKWFFYVYYPAHLIVIGLIRLALHGDTAIIF